MGKKDTLHELILGSCKNKSCTNIAQVTGSNPVQAWVDIFQALNSQNCIVMISQSGEASPCSLQSRKNSQTVKLVRLFQVVNLIF